MADQAGMRWHGLRQVTIIWVLCMTPVLADTFADHSTRLTETVWNHSAGTPALSHAALNASATREAERQGPLSSLTFAVANESAKLDTQLLLATSANVTNLPLRIHISGFNLSTFGIVEQLQFIEDLMNATSGIHKVYITNLTSGSIVVTSSVVIDNASIPAFAQALADNTALPLSRYQSTFLLENDMTSLNQDIAAIVAGIAGNPCPTDCPYSFSSKMSAALTQQVCGSCCPRNGQTCAAYASPPNGCGSDSGASFKRPAFVAFLIDLVGDVGTAALFNPICDKHDICYSTPDQPQDACDQALLQSLMQVCYGVFGRSVNEVSDRYNAARLPFCLSDAQGVYKVLSVVGDGAYKSAQDEAIPYAQECLNPPQPQAAQPQCAKCKHVQDTCCDGTLASCVCSSGYAGYPSGTNSGQAACYGKCSVQSQDVQAIYQPDGSVSCKSEPFPPAYVEYCPGSQCKDCYTEFIERAVPDSPPYPCSGNTLNFCTDSCGKVSTSNDDESISPHIPPPYNDPRYLLYTVPTS